MNLRPQPLQQGSSQPRRYGVFGIRSAGVPSSLTVAVSVVALLAALATGSLALPAEKPGLGYDPQGDPAKDLAAAVAEAQQSGRRILLVVGGEWCVWCHILDRFLKEHPGIHAAWSNGFVTVKVHDGEENPNEAFLSQFPEVPGYPHFFVLEKDGTLLHSQHTDRLESGKSYSEKKMLQFLRRWSPHPDPR